MSKLCTKIYSTAAACKLQKSPEKFHCTVIKFFDYYLDQKEGEKKKFGTIKKDFFKRKKLEKIFAQQGLLLILSFKTKSFINTQVFRFIQSRAYQQK